ncbi:MAG: hypothetical protein U0P30_13150 [Vicinamibacterales bacterium]
MFSSIAYTEGLGGSVLAALCLCALCLVPVHARSESSVEPFAVNHHEVKAGEVAAAIDRAASGAARRLSRESCSRVLSDFADRGGRPLREVMVSMGLAPTDALSRIIFRDGSDAAACQARALAAFTGPGSRVVFVCGKRFQTFPSDVAERVVIHELLHTLGLAEGPPTPAAIDRAVERRCG